MRRHLAVFLSATPDLLDGKRSMKGAPLFKWEVPLAGQHFFEFLFLDIREGKVCVAEVAADAIASSCSYTRYRIASQEKILSPKPVRYVCTVE